MTKDMINILCNDVRESGYELHRYLRHGHLEKVYENGLANRLQKKGFMVSQQFPVQVTDEDGSVLGDMKADLLVENELLNNLIKMFHNGVIGEALFVPFCG